MHERAQNGLLFALRTKRRKFTASDTTHARFNFFKRTELLSAGGVFADHAFLDAFPAECRPLWPAKRMHCWPRAVDAGHWYCSFAIFGFLTASYLSASRTGHIF